MASRRRCRSWGARRGRRRWSKHRTSRRCSEQDRIGPSLSIENFAVGRTGRSCTLYKAESVDRYSYFNFSQLPPIIGRSVLATEMWWTGSCVPPHWSPSASMEAESRHCWCPTGCLRASLPRRDRLPPVLIMCRPRPTPNASRKGACECIWGMAQARRVLPPRVAVDWTGATRHHTTSFPRALLGLTDSQLQPGSGVPFFPLSQQLVPLPALASSCILIRSSATSREPFLRVRRTPAGLPGADPLLHPWARARQPSPVQAVARCMMDGALASSNFSVLVVQCP